MFVDQVSLEMGKPSVARDRSSGCRSGVTYPLTRPSRCCCRACVSGLRRVCVVGDVLRRGPRALVLPKVAPLTRVVVLGYGMAGPCLLLLAFRFSLWNALFPNGLGWELKFPYHPNSRNSHKRAFLQRSPVDFNGIINGIISSDAMNIWAYFFQSVVESILEGAFC